MKIYFICTNFFLEILYGNKRFKFTIKLKEVEYGKSNERAAGMQQLNKNTCNQSSGAIGLNKKIVLVIMLRYEAHRRPSLSDYHDQIDQKY